MKITHARNKTQTSTIKLLKCFPISVALSTTSKSSLGCRIPFLQIVSFPLPSSYQDSKISKLWCSQKPRWMCVRSTPLALSNFKCKNIIFEFFAVSSVWYRGEKTEIKGKESYITPIQGRQPVKKQSKLQKEHGSAKNDKPKCHMSWTGWPNPFMNPAIANHEQRAVAFTIASEAPSMKISLYGKFSVLSEINPCLSSKLLKILDRY